MATTGQSRGLRSEHPCAPVEGKPRSYKVRGRLRGQALSLLYEQVSGGGFETGVMLRTVDPSGAAMEGYEIEYNPTAKRIVPSKYE
jgi:hypothetical protein